jgi:hypothetical protein
MSGSITELIATGSLDSYLTGGAEKTWWKARYAKHTQFAMESCRQVFGTHCGFGCESTLTLNRTGDLVHFLYVCIELPGIYAQPVSGAGGMRFPTTMNQSCAPCAAEDDMAYASSSRHADLVSEADSEARRDHMKGARDDWLKQNYGHAPTLECCEDVEDCPDNLCPELGNMWCHYTNAVGQVLLKQTKLVIGGATVDTIESAFLFMWEELSGKSGRRLTELIGKRYTRTQLVCDSRQKRTLYVPVPFFFTQHSGSALALSSLQFHGVQLHVTFEDLRNCIVVSSDEVAVYNATTHAPITENDLKAHIEATYIFLENSERAKFQQQSYEVLVSQHQSFMQHVSGSDLRLVLNFNHPVKQLIFACRRGCQEQCNNWFNFSGIANRDPITEVELLLNNQPRFAKKPGMYFRTVQPLQHHSNIPDAFVYTFSFALHPESFDPSGSTNFSRIDHIELKLTLQPGLAREKVNVLIYARSLNILRFRDGLAGMAFAN